MDDMTQAPDTSPEDMLPEARRASPLNESTQGGPNIAGLRQRPENYPFELPGTADIAARRRARLEETRKKMLNTAPWPGLTPESEWAIFTYTAPLHHVLAMETAVNEARALFHAPVRVVIQKRWLKWKARLVVKSSPEVIRWIERALRD